jgi:hypothetical protein
MAKAAAGASTQGKSGITTSRLITYNSQKEEVVEG